MKEVQPVFVGCVGGTLKCLFCVNRQKSEEKRGGSGSHNWGNVKDEARCVGHTSISSSTDLRLNSRNHLSLPFKIFICLYYNHQSICCYFVATYRIFFCMSQRNQ